MEDIDKVRKMLWTMMILSFPTFHMSFGKNWGSEKSDKQDYWEDKEEEGEKEWLVCNHAHCIGTLLQWLFVVMNFVSDKDCVISLSKISSCSANHDISIRWQY